MTDVSTTNLYREIHEQPAVLETLFATEAENAQAWLR